MNTAKTFEEIVNSIKAGIEMDANVAHYVKAYAETSDLQTAIEDIADYMHEAMVAAAAEGVTFNETTESFTIDLLQTDGFLKAPDTFEGEEAANIDGYYWFDELDAWLKVDRFNN